MSDDPLDRRIRSGYAERIDHRVLRPSRPPSTATAKRTFPLAPVGLAAAIVVALGAIALWPAYDPEVIASDDSGVTTTALQPNVDTPPSTSTDAPPTTSTIVPTCHSEEPVPRSTAGAAVGVTTLESWTGPDCRILVIRLADSTGEPAGGFPAVSIEPITNTVLRVDLAGVNQSYVRDPQHEGVLRAFVASLYSGGISVIVESPNEVASYSVREGGEVGTIAIEIVEANEAGATSPISWEQRALITAQPTADGATRITGYISAFESTALFRFLDSEGNLIDAECVTGCTAGEGGGYLSVRAASPSWGEIAFESVLERPPASLEVSTDSAAADVPSWSPVPILSPAESNSSP